MSSSSTDEKVDQNDQHDHEYAEEHGIPDQLAPPHIDHEAERRAVRKLDYSIIPMISMFYLLSFLDRSNIGNARVAGLEKDLKMTDHQYSIAVTALYVPYIVSEIPANLILRKIGPKILMPSLLTLWGIMVTLQGLTTSYGGLVTVRFFLGLVEGPMFPGIVLYLSYFYTREELALRVALFFSTASLSGAFSGLLAAAIQHMDGLGGKAGWSWIFILEGLFSMLVGILGFFIIPSTPRGSKFLTDAEKDLIEGRLLRDRQAVKPIDRFGWGQVFKSLSSPHVLLLFIIFFMLGTTLYGLALFLPSIVQALGHSPTKTQLLSVGPFAGGFVVTLFSAYWSDRYKSRAVPGILITLLAIVGFGMWLGSSNKHVAYASLYLSVPGVYAAVPVIIAWVSNNSEPHYRRATSIAVSFVATNSGGILSTWSFPTKEGPRFTKTTIMDLTFECLVVVFIILNYFYLSYQNKQKKLRRDELLKPFVSEKEPDGGMEAVMVLGDKHPDFIYTL